MKKLVMRMLLSLAPVIFQVILDVFKNLHSKDVLERAVTLARLHVQNFDKSGIMKNGEKREQVAKALKRDLRAAGLEARDSLVNLAIELAVNAVKAEAAKRL